MNIVKGNKNAAGIEKLLLAFIKSSSDLSQICHTIYCYSGKVSFKTISKEYLTWNFNR